MTSARALPQTTSSACGRNNDWTVLMRQNMVFSEGSEPPPMHQLTSPSQPSRLFTLTSCVRQRVSVAWAYVQSAHHPKNGHAKASTTSVMIKQHAAHKRFDSQEHRHSKLALAVVGIRSKLCHRAPAFSSDPMHHVDVHCLVLAIILIDSDYLDPKCRAHLFREFP